MTVDEAGIPTQQIGDANSDYRAIEQFVALLAVGAIRAAMTDAADYGAATSSTSGVIKHTSVC